MENTLEKICCSSGIDSCDHKKLCVERVEDIKDMINILNQEYIEASFLQKILLIQKTFKRLVQLDRNAMQGSLKLFEIPPTLRYLADIKKSGNFFPQNKEDYIIEKNIERDIDFVFTKCSNDYKDFISPREDFFSYPFSARGATTASKYPTIRRQEQEVKYRNQDLKVKSDSYPHSVSMVHIHPPVPDVLKFHSTKQNPFPKHSNNRVMFSESFKKNFSRNHFDPRGRKSWSFNDNQIYNNQVYTK
jgi:hypothetical protein